MLLHCFILLFLTHTTVESWSSLAPATTGDAPVTTTTTTTVPSTTAAITSTTAEAPQLEAVPDYPVAAGQQVNLRCRSFNVTSSITWSWQRLQNENWTAVASGQDLTLTEPRQSGHYRCLARWGASQGRESSHHAVLIVSMPATADGAVGKAALFFSLLAFILSLATPLWMYLQSADNTVLKGFPKAESSPEAGLPKKDGDGDIYMNYADNNPAYSDLDPSSMHVDNVYSSLS